MLGKTEDGYPTAWRWVTLTSKVLGVISLDFLLNEKLKMAVWQA